MRYTKEDVNALRWHIFFTLKKLKSTLEKPSISQRGRKLLDVIHDNLSNIEITGNMPFDDVAKGLSLVNEIISGIDYGEPEWPNKVLKLYGPPVKCIVIPFVSMRMAMSDIRKYLPRWRQPCEWYIFPFSAGEGDSPLHIELLSKLLDEAWSMYDQRPSNRFSLIFAPAISFLTSNYAVFNWADVIDMNWPDEMKGWLRKVAHASQKSEIKHTGQEWNWDEICYAVELLLKNIPPCQIKDKPLEIANILIAGAIATFYKTDQGASFEEIGSLERLIAFACDGSLFLSQYQKRS